MRSRSDSDPTRMPTTGASAGGTYAPVGSDVAAAPHPVGRDRLASAIRTPARIRDALAESGHVEDASAVRHETVFLQRGAGVEDERAGGLCVGDPLDRRADIV